MAKLSKRKFNRVTLNKKIQLWCFTFIFSFSAYAQVEMVEAFSSNANDYNFNVSAKYDRAVFARADDNFENGKVWQALRGKDGHFLPAEMLTLGPSQYKYSDPMLTHDGKTLIFISDRPLNEDDTATDYNVWQASLINGHWQEIKPLPESVNSSASELGPELHNGVLYFSSAKDGQLKLYQGIKQGDAYEVSEYSPLSGSQRARSDLTFSPDGNLALFWQHSDDKKDTKLMMQRKQKEAWSQPIEAPAIIQSEHFEYTPQFSPDGQWLYFASEKPTESKKGLSIHKVSSLKVFPSDWYTRHLGAVTLDILATQAELQRINGFSYTLKLLAQDKPKIEYFAIGFSPFEVCKKTEDTFTWTDGKKGIKHSLKQSRELNNSEVTQLVKGARYNFIHMFKQESTALYQQYANENENGRVFRIHATGLNDFTVLLDNKLTLIEELRYDDQAIGLEYDYQRHQNIFWPMKFDFLVEGISVAKGEFSNLKFNEDNRCDALKVESQ